MNIRARPHKVAWDGLLCASFRQHTTAARSEHASASHSGIVAIVPHPPQPHPQMPIIIRNHTVHQQGNGNPRPRGQPELNDSQWRSDNSLLQNGIRPPPLMQQAIPGFIGFDGGNGHTTQLQKIINGAGYQCSTSADLPVRRQCRRPERRNRQSMRCHDGCQQIARWPDRHLERLLDVNYSPQRY